MIEDARPVIFFISLVILGNSTATHKQQTVQTKLVRSFGVAVHRQREMMIIANAENVESAEWKEDHLDLTE